MSQDATHVHFWQLWIDPKTADIPDHVVLQCATCPTRQRYRKDEPKAVEHG